ncbi:DUF2179 domain-containing protein [Atopobacter phocae]|uniref:DUF2179 domain-containing protein n=1 Tax=Atopobacter phocae TaxID=136492 RepID=UPI0004728F2C|nr:DUF2179 domain-containing protein [Atopobacter phocae]
MKIEFAVLIQIFVINFCYITLNTVRFMLTMKGYRYLAPIVSFFEIIIYILGLSLVMNSLNNIWNVGMYAFGYAVGISFGIFLENRMALGYSLQRVVLPSSDHQNLVNFLRDKGYGVTVWTANGRDGERLVMEILSKRKDERRLRELVLEQAPQAFIVMSEPKYIHGGFWSKRVKKRIGRK